MSTRVAPEKVGNTRPIFSPAIQNSGKKLRKIVSGAISSAMPQLEAAV
jgi:hypothetical protein